jgi:hypothetical protein
MDPTVKPRRTADDSDGDGLSDRDERLLCSCPFDADSDHDGLPDGWEYRGVVGVKHYDLSLRHRNVLVWVDWNSKSELPEDFTSIVEAFDNAPVENPDGQRGIKLILEIAGSPANVITDAPDTADAIIRRRRVLGAARTMMHYMIWSDQIDAAKHSGIAIEGTHGPDFIVSLGAWPVVPEDAKTGTFMHEIGHTFGLHHGGVNGAVASELVNAPNHLSVMSYRYQATGVSYGRGRSFTYQPGPTIGLDESQLDEYRGLGLSPLLANYRVEWDGTDEFADSEINWNHRNDLEHHAQWDLDGDRRVTSHFPPIDPEWNALDLTCAGIIGSHYTQDDLEHELAKRASQAQREAEITPVPALQRSLEANFRDKVDRLSEKLDRALDVIAP